MAEAATAPPSDAGAGNGILNGVLSAHSDFVAYLYEPKVAVLDENVGKFEQNTGVKREQVMYGVAGLVALYLIAGSSALFLSTIIGCAYPIYASIKGARGNNADAAHWLVFWSVFGVFSILDCGSEGIMSWFPLYFLLKTVTLVFLYLPQTQGSKLVLTMAVEPLMNMIGTKQE